MLNLVVRKETARLGKVKVVSSLIHFTAPCYRSLRVFCTLETSNGHNHELSVLVDGCCAVSPRLCCSSTAVSLSLADWNTLFSISWDYH